MVADYDAADAANGAFVDLNQLALDFHLGSFHGDFLYWGFYQPVYWRNYWHVHSFFEICYAYQGRGTFRIGGETLTVGAGQLFVAKPDEPHEIISSRNDPLGIYFWSYTLLPVARSQTQAAGIAHNQAAAADLDQLIYAYIHATKAISEENTAIATILRGLTHEIRCRQPGYQMQIQSLTLSLLIATARAVVDVPIAGAPLNRSGNAAVDTMLRYLQDNYDRPLQVRDVAAQLHMSVRHTSRLFRQATGQSIQQYLAELRLTVAKQQLLDPTRSITAIATATGYSDVRHFSTRFHQQTGMTPTQFRTAKGTLFSSPL